MDVRDRTRIGKVVTAFRQGLSTQEVARTLGISEVRVTRILRESDLPQGPRDRPRATGARASD